MDALDDVDQLIKRHQLALDEIASYQAPALCDLLGFLLPRTRVNRLVVRLVRTPHRTPATRSPS
jgi:hypothetical protein